MKLSSVDTPHTPLAVYDPGSSSPFAFVSVRNPTLSIAEQGISATNGDDSEDLLDEIVATFVFAEQRRRRQREMLLHGSLKRS